LQGFKTACQSRHDQVSSNQTLNHHWAFSWQVLPSAPIEPVLVQPLTLAVETLAQATNRNEGF